MADVFRCIDFDFLSRFLEGLQKFLGEKCEIVIHDYRKGYDNSLVYAINAQLSGRKVGDSPRGGMIANVGKDIDSLKDSKIFFYAGSKGQLFKSCTTLIADKNNKIIGSVCMNMEISDFFMAQNAIQNFIQHTVNDSENRTSSADILTRNVDEMLSYYIQQSEQLIGKPMPLMSKEEKIKALDYLDQKGVFKITKASNLLCDVFKVSRFTLYGYLEEAKNQRKSE